MNELFRARIDESTLAEANRIAAEHGTSTQELVRIYLTNLARAGDGIPKIARMFPFDSASAAGERLKKIGKLWAELRPLLPERALVKELDAAIRGSKDFAGQAAAGDPVVSDKRA